MTNGSIIEIENDVLRDQVKTLRAAVKKLARATDDYLWKAGLRPAVVNAVEEVKRLL